MLKLGALLFAAAIAATGPIPNTKPEGSQQPPPAKGQAVDTQQADKGTDSKQTTAQKPPPKGDVAISKKLDRDANKAGENAKAEDSKWLDPTTVFNFFLVLIGAVQAIIIYRQMKIMDRSDLTSAGALSISKQAFDVAKQAAIAAETSTAIAERALIELEAPHVFIDITSSGLEQRGGNRVPQELFRYLFVNYGRTPAHLLQIEEYIEAIVADGSQTITPAQPDITKLPYGVIAAPNRESQEFTFNFGRFTFDIFQDTLFDHHRHYLFLIIKLEYADIFGNAYESGFRFQHDMTHNRWMLAGGADHNYRRRKA